MTKEQEIMNFLHERVFDPVLNSSDAHPDIKEIKAGVERTIVRMKKRDARGMVKFYKTAISGTARSIKFVRLMKDAGFTCFEDVQEEFGSKFNEDWLKQ